MPDWLDGSAVFGMVIGILAGIPLTVVADAFLKFRRRKDLLKHLAADFRNANRHFSLVTGEMEFLKDEPEWKAAARLKWTTFSRRGFFTHSQADLYLLKDSESAAVMTLITFMNNYGRACGNACRYDVEPDRSQSLRRRS